MMPVPDPVRHGNLLGSLADDEVREIVAACRQLHLRGGEAVCRQGERGDSMFVIVRGRVSIDVAAGAARQLINHLGPGDHFGEMSLLLDSPRSANVTAVTDTELLELARADFERIMAGVPGFAANLSRSLGVWLRGQISGSRRPERMQVALVRACPAAAGLAWQLAAAVAAEGGELHVLSDQQPRRPIGAWQSLLAGDDFERQALDHLANLAADKRRVLLDLDPARAMPRLLLQQDLIWWVVAHDSPEQEREIARLREVLSVAPRLARRIQLVWAIGEGSRLPPAGGPALTLTQPALRIQHAGEGAGASFHPRDLARLTRHLRGIQLGLALGGGGARGIAHIGVLEVCQREGIYFDRVAGTSAGAIAAAAYAAGIPCPRMREVFQKEMTPPAALRWLPRARQWHLLAVFRLGLAEAKFRRYLYDYTFEQLLLPAQTVAVDLISGEHRVRGSGDVVSAVLESINHPVLGRPILRDGEALVDGAVLMNVPVTVLRQENVDFSVAVDVSKRLSPTLAGNTKDTPTVRMRRPGYLSTLLRVTDVQLRHLTALHGSQADFSIAPETADFPFDDFSQVDGLVDAGRRAAEEALPRLKQLLREHLGWEQRRSSLPISGTARLREAA
jgi:predicted acylesterase/phospholipase RssA